MKSHNYRFGAKIRLVRERRGLTLKEVAQSAQVSESLVSQIERDKVSPSIDTLMAIAEVLDLNVEYLFQDFKKKKKAAVLTPEQQNRLILNGVTYHQMAYHPEAPESPSLEVLKVEIPPGAAKGDDEFGHLGREVGIIIDGTGELLYGEESYPLKAGDTVAFSSDMPHTIRNTGKKPLESIWIITPGRIFR